MGLNQLGQLTFRRIEGKATPAAWKTFPATPGASLRSRKRVPCFSISISSNLSRSRTTEAHSRRWAC